MNPAKNSNKFSFYSILCWFTSLLFAGLFFTLMFRSGAFLSGLGVGSSMGTFFLARRASIFMLGVSVLLFSCRNLSHSKARQNICLANGITMLGLAFMGSFELLHHNINGTIVPPILIEITAGLSFFGGDGGQSEPNSNGPHRLTVVVLT